jgi:preprotein translocase subunit SecB
MSKTNANGKAPENTPIPPLLIKAQYIKDLSFENPNILEILQGLEASPEVSVNVRVEANPISDTDFEVILFLNASATHAEKTLFMTELAYGGIFQISPDVPQESQKAILFIECPRLLFPFARNVLADVTRDGGLPPVFLHPIDFVGLYQQKM